MTSAYERTIYGGHVVNRRTAQMLWQMSDYLYSGTPLTVLQGSYNTSVSASYGTHAGGGAVDLSAFDWERKVECARMVGFAAWHRPTLPDEWTEHIHMIALGDKEMSATAVKQVQDYYAHLDGLASHAYDPEWRPTHIVSFHYPLPAMALARAQHQAMRNDKSPIPSVKLIQRALNIRTGTMLAVDGIYGSATRDAYKRYERQNGGDGDGVPGALAKKLGLALYKVV